MKDGRKMLNSVGILTFTYGDNYGQRLQNLAMQEFLKNYFYHVYTIRHIEKEESLFCKVKHSAKLLVQGRFFIFRKRRNSFNKFNDSYIKFYSIPIDTNDVTAFPRDKFDFFICGSDQIWSPYSCDVNNTFFLTFVEKNKRIALAPSIASEDIPQDKVEEFREYFKGFNYISTREYAGSNLVQKLTGNLVETLIDPTLLFDSDFWVAHEKQPKNICQGRYAVCYFLGNTSQLDKINEICRNEGLTVIDILHDKKYLSLGPDEFIYLIHNAQKVFTDSYHGTIFSIIFHVPLILCNREGSKINMNSRFETLFSKLGIYSKPLQNTMSDVQVDYLEVENNIVKERNVFENYFHKCLSKSLK